MGLLDGLFGNDPMQNQQNPQYQNSQNSAMDFVQRYMSGHPSEGYSHDEAYQNYRSVASNMSQQDYELSAEEAFARMSSDERRQFAQMLSQQARSQNISFPDSNQDGIDDRMQDPRELARRMSYMQREQPGFFDRLFGGGNDNSYQQQNYQQQDGGMMSSPVAKAAMAGIAAFAVKRMLGNNMRRGA